MSGDELTDNEPTERYWRDIGGRIDPVPPGFPQATFEEVIALRLRTEVVVLTPAELSAHTTAARADERERIAAAIEAQIIRNAGGHPYNLHSDGLKSAARIARTPDPNGDDT